MEGPKSFDEKVVAISREGEVHPGAWVGPEEGLRADEEAE